MIQSKGFGEILILMSPQLVIRSYGLLRFRSRDKFTMFIEDFVKNNERLFLLYHGDYFEIL